jgi:hypothetical protein
MVLTTNQTVYSICYFNSGKISGMFSVGVENEKFFFPFFGKFYLFFAYDNKRKGKVYLVVIQLFFPDLNIVGREELFGN